MVMRITHPYHPYAYIMHISLYMPSCLHIYCLSDFFRTGKCFRSHICTIQSDMHGYTLAIPLLYHCMCLLHPIPRYIIGIHIVYGIYHDRRCVICLKVSFPTRFLMVYKRIPHIPYVIPCYTCIPECYTFVLQCYTAIYQLLVPSRVTHICTDANTLY